MVLLETFCCRSCLHAAVFCQARIHHQLSGCKARHALFPSPSQLPVIHVVQPSKKHSSCQTDRVHRGAQGQVHKRSSMQGQEHTCTRGAQRCNSTDHTATDPPCCCCCHLFLLLPQQLPLTLSFARCCCLLDLPPGLLCGCLIQEPAYCGHHQAFCLAARTIWEARLSLAARIYFAHHPAMRTEMYKLSNARSVAAHGACIAYMQARSAYVSISAFGRM